MHTLVSGLGRYMYTYGHWLEIRNSHIAKVHGLIYDHLHHNVTRAVFALASSAEGHFLRRRMKDAVWRSAIARRERFPFSSPSKNTPRTINKSAQVRG